MIHVALAYALLASITLAAGTKQTTYLSYRITADGHGGYGWSISEPVVAEEWEGFSANQCANEQADDTPTDFILCIPRDIAKRHHLLEPAEPAHRDPGGSLGWIYSGHFRQVDIDWLTAHGACRSHLGARS